MITRAKAYQLREIIEKAAVSLDDTDALEAVELFPIWKAGVAYETGDRVRYNDILYRCLQSHTSQDDWIPDVAPSLFAVVLIPDPETIPVWTQPDSTNAYSKGDKVHFPDENGSVYESLIDNNVWSPEDYPAGWKVV